MSTITRKPFRSFANTFLLDGLSQSHRPLPLQSPITITIREEELQKELVDLIHSVEQESKKEEIDIPRIMKVLAAARAMLEEEKERIRKDICEIDPNEIVQEKEEKVETVETVEKEEVAKEEEEEEWNLFGEPNEVKKGEWGSDEIEGEDEETEEKMAAKPSVEEEKGKEEKPVVEEKVEKETIEDKEEEPIVEEEEWILYESQKAKPGEWGSEEEEEEETIVETEKPIVKKEPLEEEEKEEKPIVETEKPDVEAEEEWFVYKSEEPKPGEWGSDEVEEEEKVVETVETVETVEAVETMEKEEEKVEEEQPIVEEETESQTVETESQIVETEPQTVETDEPVASPCLPSPSNSMESSTELEESEEEWHPFQFHSASTSTETPSTSIETPSTSTETPSTSTETPSTAFITPPPPKPIDWDHVKALLAEARACLLPPESTESSTESSIESSSTEQQLVLRQVEAAVMSQVDSLASQLNQSLQSRLTDDLSAQIDSLEQQLRDSAVQESRRLYSMLKQQREDLTASMNEQLERLEVDLRAEIGQQIDSEKMAEIRSILAQYNREIAQIRRQYVDYKDDLIYEREMLTKGRVLSEEITQNEAWVARIVQEMNLAQSRVDSEKSQRLDALKAFHAKLQHLVEQLEAQEALLSNMLKTQEYQRAIWEMQEHIIAKVSISADLDRLVKPRPFRSLTEGEGERRPDSAAPDQRDSAVGGGEARSGRVVLFHEVGVEERRDS